MRRLSQSMLISVLLLAIGALGCNLLSCPWPGAIVPSVGETPSPLEPFGPPAVSSPLPTLPAIIPAAPLCSDPQPDFVTDFEVRQTPQLSEPPARVPFRDPVFGTCVVRVTDRTADRAADDLSPGLKNEYSRIQSFNANESRILVRGTRATWYLYDAQTLQPLGQLPFGGSLDPRWDATNPDLLYYNEETRLMAYNVGTGETRLAHDFAADFPGQTLAAVWTKYEGSPSSDGRYWGFMAEDENWVTVAFLVYDLASDQVIATRDVRGAPGVEGVDNAYISPLGDYFIADFSDYYCERGQLGSDAQPCGYMVYDRNLENGRGLMRISGHQDLALDAEGREVVVYQDIDTDHISMLDLATGTVTPLWPIDFSYTPLGLHISGRAFNRPGWVLVSTYYGGYPTDYTWMDNAVFAIELKPDGRVVRLAHTHSVFQEGAVSYDADKDYYAEPHGSVNRDFTRILFTSNWGRSGTEEVEMFMIELPPNWTELLP